MPMTKIKAIGQLGKVVHHPAGTTKNNYNNYHQRYLIPSSVLTLSRLTCNTEFKEGYCSNASTRYCN